MMEFRSSFGSASKLGMLQSHEFPRPAKSVRKPLVFFPADRGGRRSANASAPNESVGRSKTDTRSVTEERGCRALAARAAGLGVALVDCSRWSLTSPPPTSRGRVERSHEQNGLCGVVEGAGVAQRRGAQRRRTRRSICRRRSRGGPRREGGVLAPNRRCWPRPGHDAALDLRKKPLGPERRCARQTPQRRATGCGVVEGAGRRAAAGSAPASHSPIDLQKSAHSRGGRVERDAKASARTERGLGPDILLNKPPTIYDLRRSEGPTS